MAIQYYIIDTETNGVNSAYHEITEIGIIRCTDRVQLYRQIKCEYPERSNIDALKITNKTLDDLSRGFDKNIIVSECNKFFNEDGLTPAHRCIVAHNYSFDKRFLHALWEKCDEQFPADLWLCTMAMSRDYAKKQGIKKPKVNLHDACDMLGVKKLSDKHNAKTDSRNTFLLHKNLVEEKKLDFLPFIKNASHNFNNVKEDLIDFSEDDIEKVE